MLKEMGPLAEAAGSKARIKLMVALGVSSEPADIRACSKTPFFEA